MSNTSEKWVVTIYDGMDKIMSKNYIGEEEEVYKEAKKWVEKEFSGYDNWTIHHVV